MHSRILGREVARARLHLADELPPVGERRRHDRSRRERAETNLQPVALRRIVPEQDQPPADRVDRDVEVAVVVVVGRREASSVHRGRAREPGGLDGREARLLARPGHVLEDLHASGVLREVHDGDRAVRQDEVEIAVQVQVGPGHAPSRRVRADCSCELGARIGERRALCRPEAPVGGVQLVARVRDEDVRPPVAGEVLCRDSHARVRVGDVLAFRDVLEAEAEMLGIGVGATLQRDVLVELVGIRVVRDVQVETPVVVEVREDRSEAVRDLRPLDARRSSDLSERRVPVLVGAFVQVEEIADGCVVGWEAGRRVDDEVRIGVRRDEEIRPPVPVDVADDGCRVPRLPVDAGPDGAFGERPVPVVPKERVPGVRRDVVPGAGHVEVGATVHVEVGCHTAVSANGEVGAGARRHVHEPSSHVVVERGSREAAVGVRGNDVDVRVRVDDEEVQPAVRVVVQPAEPAPHHRRRVEGLPVPERTLAEVEPDLVCDVHERRASERAARCCGSRRRCCEAALGANDAIPAVLEPELDGSPEALRILTAHERRSPAVGRRDERALEVRDDRWRPLVRPALQGHHDSLDVVLRHGRPRRRSAHL